MLFISISLLLSFTYGKHTWSRDGIGVLMMVGAFEFFAEAIILSNYLEAVELANYLQ